MTDKLETKYVPFDLELKQEDGKSTISGLGAAYGNVDFGADLIEPGAFKSALADGAKMPKMLWQHDPSQVIGVWTGLTDSSKGLKTAGHILTELPRGAEANILLKHKAIDGLSIGYVTKDFEFKTAKDGRMIRHIKAVDLLEISIVTFPMNPKALVTDVKQLQSPREVETILRSAGVPATFAKLVASHGFEEAKKRLATDQREVGAMQDSEPQAAFTRLLEEVRQLKEMMKNG